MNLEASDLRDAGHLLQLGLRPKEHPAENPDYQRLLRRHDQDADFRAALREIASGLGLEVLAADTLGLVLAPGENSAFTMRRMDYPASAREAGEDRLIDGLIHVAVLATVYPRAEDLDGDLTDPRPAISVNDVELTLRELCARLKAEAQADAGAADPTTASIASGLRAAWHVYESRPPSVGTEDGRASPRATRKRIENVLEFLLAQGAFRRTRRGNEMFYQPAWRYQILVQNFAADRMAVAVRELLGTTKTLGKEDK